MFNFLDSVSFQYLIIFSVLLALAPFQPEPHLVEKLRMLKDGTLVRPLDIFDLLMHSTPLLLLLIKVIREFIIK